MDVVAYVIAVLAIIVMGANVYQAIALKRRIVGGEVGQRWGLLTFLVAFFFVGYVVAPATITFHLPERLMFPIVFAVFLFGAVFVWVVIGIVRDTLDFLKLLK